jgi:hypothetical protein
MFLSPPSVGPPSLLFSLGNDFFYTKKQTKDCQENCNNYDGMNGKNPLVIQGLASRDPLLGYDGLEFPISKCQFEYMMASMCQEWNTETFQQSNGQSWTGYCTPKTLYFPLTWYVVFFFFVHHGTTKWFVLSGT